MDDVPFTIDVSTSADLRKLVEDVAERGAGCILARGDTPVALVTPLPNGDDPPRRRKRRNPERVLDIIGIGSSGGSNIARYKDDYIADAVDHRSM